LYPLDLPGNKKHKEKKMNKNITFGLLLLTVVALGMPGALAATSVDYTTTIQPIFNSHCTSCHGASSPSAGYSLTSYNGTMTGGRVTPGDAAGSILYNKVNGGGMPPGGALTAAEIQSIADWINQGALATAPVTPVTPITPVTPGNTAPVANDQAVTTPEGTPVAVTLNATDADGNTLNYTVVSNPAHGNLSGTAPALTYTPDTGFNGSDSFTFKANDGTVDSNTATVSITVTSETVPVVPAPAHNDEHDGEHYVRNHHHHRTRSNSESSD
jgi:mono/diheme cytochrome c family protein